METSKTIIIKHFVDNCTKYQFETLKQADIDCMYSALVSGECCPDNYSVINTDDKLYCPRLCQKVDKIPMSQNTVNKQTCKNCWIKSKQALEINNI